MRGVRRHWRAILGTTAAVPAALFTAFVVLAGCTSKPYRIPASSMEPTLRCARPAAGCTAGHSDRVLVSRVLFYLRKPHRGDLVAFHTPPLAKERCGVGGVFIKRIVAVGGETWEERNGVVYVNGQKLPEPYVKGAYRDSTGASFPKRTVPRGQYFVLGDNRTRSCDSREWGPVKRSALIGPVIATYWPPRRWSIR